MMETVPTVRVLDGIDAVVLPDLPGEIAPAMSDIAGLAVMQTMFEAELTETCGLKGEHNPDRVAVSQRTEKGSRVPSTRADVRTTSRGTSDPASQVYTFMGQFGPLWFTIGTLRSKHLSAIWLGSVAGF
jgi:hypothetical protein